MREVQTPKYVNVDLFFLLIILHSLGEVMSLHTFHFLMSIILCSDLSENALVGSPPNLTAISTLQSV
jgi:hypothetical protein